MKVMFLSLVMFLLFGVSPGFAINEKFVREYLEWAKSQRISRKAEIPTKSFRIGDTSYTLFEHPYIENVVCTKSSTIWEGQMTESLSCIHGELKEGN